jgi:2,3-diketo-5-methylthio-1-phosphopentane phosphatase
MTIPPAAQAELWIDFDGTISAQDVLDELIRRFAVDDSWKLVELQWQQGLIGSYECLGKQIGLIRARQGEMMKFVDSIGLDPGVHRLLGLLDEARVPTRVVSDGIDLVIDRLLAKNGITGLEVRSNTVVRTGDRIALRAPHRREGCDSGSAHCKCGSIEALGDARRRTIYVGDGRSDLCPARKAECVFAKGNLAACLAKESRPFIPWTTLGDVAGHLSRAWGLEVSAA